MFEAWAIFIYPFLRWLFLTIIFQQQEWMFDCSHGLRIFFRAPFLSDRTSFSLKVEHVDQWKVISLLLFCKKTVEMKENRVTFVYFNGLKLKILFIYNSAMLINKSKNTVYINKQKKKKKKKKKVFFLF
jgi:hypothetical protein